MELQKGTCFLCHNTKIIKSSRSQEANQIISLLLPKEMVDSTEFSKVQSALKLCPICYHKLIILKRVNESVNLDVSNEATSTSCLLCKSEKYLFQINSWPRFKEITQDITLSKNNNCVTCSECLFYLETKNEVKTKLFSKYPQLKHKFGNNNENRKKWKLKFTPGMKLYSTQAEKNKRKLSRKRKYSEMINTSPKTGDENNINFDSLKKLSPLKNDKILGSHKLIKTDFKFLNQIPYVLINVSDLCNVQNITLHEDSNEKVFLETENAITTKHEELDRNDKDEMSKHESLKIEIDANKHDVMKQLVVNVSRMNIEKYLEKLEPDPDIQNLIDKFNILHPLNEMGESVSTNHSSILTNIEDTSFEEPETNFETKNKRKSVSFAEEKNVEIEYYQEDFTESIGKKYKSQFNNKSIEEGDETTSENEDISHQASEKEKVKRRNTLISEENNTPILLSSDSEDEENNCAGSTVSDSLLKPKENDEEVKQTESKPVFIRNVQNADLEDISDDDDIIIGSQPDNSENKVESDDEQSILKEVESEKEKPEHGEPNINEIEDAMESLTKSNTDNPEDSDENKLDDDKSNEDVCEPEGLSKESNLSNSESIEKNIVSSDDEKNNKYGESIESEDKGKLEAKKSDNLQSKLEKANVDEPEDTESEDNCKNDLDGIVNNEVTNEPVNDSQIENKKSKRERPKPLSKRKKPIADTSNDADKQINSGIDLDCNSISENINESVSESNADPCNVKIKRMRPKPLSKKKKQNVEKTEVAEKEMSTENDSDSNKNKNMDDLNVKKASSPIEDILPGNETEICGKSSELSPDLEIENNSQLQSSDQTSEEITSQDNFSEKNDDDSVLDITENLSFKEDLNTSNSNLNTEKSDTDIKNTSVLESSEEVLNKDINTTDNSITTIDSSKSTSMSDNDVTQLVDKYLIRPDNDEFINAQQKNDILKEAGKDSDEELTDMSNIDSNISKKIDTDSFSEFEKSEELGITEDDNENINSILSLLPPESPDDRLFESKNDSKNDLGEEDTNSGIKRKITDDELNTSKEKKKKRVTFSDDVT